MFKTVLSMGMSCCYLIKRQQSTGFIIIKFKKLHLYHMSKEWVYKVSKSIFSSLPPLYSLGTLAIYTIAQQRFRKGRKNLQLPRSQWGIHSFPARNEPPAALPHSLCWEKDGQQEKVQSQQGPAAAGKVSLAGVSLAVSYSRILPSPGVSPWGSSCSGFS